MRQVILSEEEIKSICSLIGKQLSSRYRFSDDIPVAVCVMNGAVPFATELLKNVTIPVMIDYIQISCNNEYESLGSVTIKKDISLDLSNRDVVIIEDVIDTGISISFLVDYINKKYHPRSVITVTMINKVSKRKMKFSPDYYGKELSEDIFITGYGLDYHNLFRNINYVFSPDEEEIKEWNKILKL